MADTKRNSLASKVATPKSGNPGTPPMQDSLDNLVSSIGARIKLTTTSPHTSTLEGTLFTACPALNVLAINTAPAPPNPSSTLVNQPGDYHIIPFNKIQNFQILSLISSTSATTNGADGTYGARSAAPSDGIMIGAVDTKRLQEREEAKVRKLQEKERKQGKGVSSEGQRIFDVCDKMYSTRWNDQDIIVSDAVIISPPYTPESCKAPKEKQGYLAQIKKVVEGERRKMADKTRQTGSSSVSPRKGG